MGNTFYFNLESNRVMKSLREIAESRVGELTTNEREENMELIWDLRSTIDAQRLTIMEIEDNLGAATQENVWLKEEVEALKIQVTELEEMIFGESQR